jgi:peptidoglycan-associated lipoprotein
MRIRVLSILAAVLLVAGCESTPENVGSAAGGGDASMRPDMSGGPISQSPLGMGGSARPGSAQEFAVSVGDRVFFDYDKYDLSGEARSTIDRQAAWLKQYPAVSVTVEGHADERGTREYNLALGERRAASVRNYLVALGVQANRISTVSFGKERPAVLGAGEQAWAQNRRAVTVIN